MDIIRGGGGGAKYFSYVSSSSECFQILFMRNKRAPCTEGSSITTATEIQNQATLKLFFQAPIPRNTHYDKFTILRCRYGETVRRNGDAQRRVLQRTALCNPQDSTRVRGTGVRCGKRTNVRVRCANRAAFDDLFHPRASPLPLAPSPVVFLLLVPPRPPTHVAHT